MTSNGTFIQTNGVQLHVQQAGPADGQLVILLHGFPEFWYGWRHQIDALAAAGFRVWAPDQRGYNLSDKPKGVTAYGIDTLVQDVVGLIDAARHEKAILIGHDWGGAVAWWVANKHPERLEKLVVISTPHHRVFAEELRTNRQQKRKSWYMLFFQLPRLPEFLLKVGNHSIFARTMRRTARDGGGIFTDDIMAHYKQAWSQPGTITAMLNWYRAIRRARPARPPSWRISVPTLYIFGKHDAFFGWQAAQKSIDLCDDGRLEMIEDATHWVAAEEPERVNQLLLDFLA